MLCPYPLEKKILKVDGKDPGLQHGDLKGVVEAGVAEAGAGGGQQVARVLNTGLTIKKPTQKTQ
jgi:hypothetical protein